MRFLDVKTDYAFKRVFGSEHSIPILRSFLNAVLEYPPEQEIVDLTIVDPYQIPVIKGMKDTYVDVKAVLRDGRRVIIEMQVLNVEGFEKRILYNAAKTYSQQLKKGEEYALLNPVIALTLTDFALFKDSPELINRFKLIEKRCLIEYNDDIELVFIELPKFTKAETQLTDIKDQWLYFVKNAGSLAAVPTVMGDDPVFRQAFDIANTANLTEEELEAQDRRHDFIILQRGALKLAEKTGLQQGFQQGLQQGIEQGVQQGIQKGIEQGVQQGLQQGIQQGIEQGVQQGIEQGIQKGIEQGVQQGIEQGVQQGIEQGVQQGIEQGVQQERVRIARMMLASGIELAQVLIATGLNETELSNT